MSEARTAMEAALLALMAARGVERADVPVLQPADPFLDMAGEDLRRRIFMTQSETGESLCLRPEFTIPVCRMHIASGKTTPRRYGYLGQVFRQRRIGGNEFYQTGIEDIGDPDHVASDARSVEDALAVLQTLLPQHDFLVLCGDKSLFEAVLSALSLPAGWQKRLLRAFGSSALMDQAFADLTRPNGQPLLDPELSARIAAEEPDPLAALIEERMQSAGMPLKASRTPREIAARLIERSNLARTRLSADMLAILRDFLAIHVAMRDARPALADFSHRHGIDLHSAVEAFTRRAEALLALESEQTKLEFDASFGRPLEYYSGFVYEIRMQESDLTLAGGGRYDRLLTLLGASQHIPAVGFSVWMDRIDHVAGLAG